MFALIQDQASTGWYASILFLFAFALVSSTMMVRTYRQKNPGRHRATRGVPPNVYSYITPKERHRVYA